MSSRGPRFSRRSRSTEVEDSPEAWDILSIYRGLVKLAARRRFMTANCYDVKY